MYALLIFCFDKSAQQNLLKNKNNQIGCGTAPGNLVSSSYAKIRGETNFCTREIPRSGSKAKDGEKKKRERD